MGTLIVSHKITDEIIQVQACVSADTDAVNMASVYINNIGLDINDYNCQIDSTFDYTFNEFKREKMVVNGAVLNKIKTVQESKEEILAVINHTYSQTRKGKDRVTDKDIYVDCVANGTTYRMNAGQDAATNMDAGVRIFELSGADYMPVVRDFYNVNHTNVPIADARSIALQQGADALNHWQQKGAMVDAINSATTVEEVQAVDITFNVNVE